VTTIADGPALQARFGAPNSLAFDAGGAIVIAEAFYEHNFPGWPRIRRLAVDGMVTTVAGDGQRGYADGPAMQAQFHFPMGPSVDRSGNIYVADDFNHVIRVIRPHGVVLTLAGTGQPGYRDGPAEAAQFDHPLWTALAPDGTLYVADSGNNCIRRIAPAERGQRDPSCLVPSAHQKLQSCCKAAPLASAHTPLGQSM
jgi:sugar lactone lactonase YvrE